MLEDALAIQRELGDLAGVSVVLSNLGAMAAAQGELARATAGAFRQSGIPCQSRGRDELRELLGELQPVEPGLVPMGAWRPEGALTRAVLERQIAYGVVARKG